MLNRKLNRMRRAKRTRFRIKKSGRVRLVVHRTPRHLYAQVIKSMPAGDKVLAVASTCEKAVRALGALRSNKESATILGNVIAERAISAGVGEVAYDRSGYDFHGVVKALAEAAREAGLKF